MKKRNLILVRHGQSEWNEKNLFTGWEDPGLTEKGSNEAKQAGVLIKALDIEFDYLFTSALIRAQLTGSIILKNMNILIAAHGNSLRSLIKYLDQISDEDIVKLEIPTGAPIHYSFDESGSVESKVHLIENS